MNKQAEVLQEIRGKLVFPPILNIPDIAYGPR